MRASIAKNRAGIANIKIFMGGPSLRAFAEAGTKKIEQKVLLGIPTYMYLYM